MKNQLLFKRFMIVLAALILLIAFIIGLRAESRRPTALTLLSREDYRAILAGCAKINPTDRRGHLCLDGIEAAFSDGAYYLSVDPDADFLSRLSWSNPGYTASFLADEIDSAPRDAMAANRMFTILVTNGSEYFIKKAVLTSLPVLSLFGDATLAYKTGSSDSSAVFRLFSPDSAAIERVSTYRLRGGSSLRHPKKPYRVTLYGGRHKKEAVPLLTMRQSEDWILLPLYTDSSRMREKLAMELWNAIADTNPVHDLAGSKMEYVELIIDGAYQGVYGLVTPLDAVQCGVKGDGNARLFKVIEYMWQYVEDNYHKDPASLSEIVELKYPAGGDWAAMYRYVDAAIVSGASDTEALDQLMDLENLVDYALFADFSAAKDNIFKNIYFVWRRGADGEYRFAKIPWDFNYTFGDTHADNDLRTTYDKILAERDIALADISILSSGGNGISARLKERYAKLRSSVLSYETLAAQLENSRLQLTESGAIRREDARWPESMPNADPAEIASFIQSRIQYLDVKYGYSESEAMAG